MTTSLEEGQRWVSAFNSSATITIPPYAVLEPYSAAFESDYITGGSPKRIAVEVAAADSYEEEIDKDTEPADFPAVDPCDPYTNPYDSSTGRVGGYMTRSDHVCFNGPAPIPPGRLGRVTFDLPTLARVCPLYRGTQTVQEDAVAADFLPQYLQVLRDEFELRPRAPTFGGIVGPSVFWLLGLDKIVDNVGICLITRRSFGI